jgi:hypothetical protein
MQRLNLALGQGNDDLEFFFLVGLVLDDNRKLSNTQTRVSLTVIPESLITTWYEQGVPIFRQEGNYRFGGDVTQNNPTSNQHDSNPAIVAPLLLWLSTMHCTIDLATRAFPCLWIKDTNKNKEEHNLKNCRWLIKHSSWGLTNRSIGELFLTE